MYWFLDYSVCVIPGIYMLYKACKTVFKIIFLYNPFVLWYIYYEYLTVICLKFIKTMTSFVVDKLCYHRFVSYNLGCKCNFPYLGSMGNDALVNLEYWLLYECVNNMQKQQHKMLKIKHQSLQVHKSKYLDWLNYCLRIGWHHVHEDDEFIIQDNQII